MSRSPDPSPSRSFATACFAVHAQAEPGVMPRVLGLFAKRGLVPTRWHSVVSGPGRDQLHMDVQIDDLPDPVFDRVAACLRELPLVDVVLTSRKG